MTVPLPVRDGVGPSVIVLPRGHWHTILDFLDEKFPQVSRQEIIARMQRGDIRDANGAAVCADARYRAEIKLYYYREIIDEIRLPFMEEVLFEDELLVVADKPHFLPVTPGGRYLQETLLVRLKRKLGIDALAPMHRIDRETAGLVVFTKQSATRGRYQSLFERREVFKMYEAWAGWREGLALPMIYRSRIEQGHHFMRMQESDSPSEPNSETLISLIDRAGPFGRYALTPKTGKKHQLRLHLAALGIPIVNDQIYPIHRPSVEEDFSRPLQLLAAQISFNDPVTGAPREFSTKIKLAGPTSLLGHRK
jgi:tRNA pseudouridine32 synthase/23S rRNA pseudouridine746 synthase